MNLVLVDPSPRSVIDCFECGDPSTEILTYTNAHGWTRNGDGWHRPGPAASTNNHQHNDECIVRLYRCENGHEVRLSLRRACEHVEPCDWKGKESCACHFGIKVAEWPS